MIRSVRPVGAGPNMTSDTTRVEHVVLNGLKIGLERRRWRWWWWWHVRRGAATAAASTARQQQDRRAEKPCYSCHVTSRLCWFLIQELLSAGFRQSRGRFKAANFLLAPLPSQPERLLSALAVVRLSDARNTQLRKRSPRFFCSGQSITQRLDRHLVPILHRKSCDVRPQSTLFGSL